MDNGKPDTKVQEIYSCALIFLNSEAQRIAENTHKHATCINGKKLISTSADRLVHDIVGPEDEYWLNMLR